MKQRRHVRPLHIGVTLGFLCLFLSGVLWIKDTAKENQYEALAQSKQPQSIVQDDAKTASKVSADSGTSPKESARDWEALKRDNPDIAAWLSVEQTPIDYPVVKPSIDKPDDYYLSHDFWGNYTTVGCPFLESGSLAAGAHALVYGHHYGTTDKQFGSLANAFAQDSFNKVGNLKWEVPSVGSLQLKPLCALSVDASFEPIQRYSFTSTSEFRQWLRSICEQSTAQAKEWEKICSSARRSVTLVTCSNVIPGQPERTLVVFAA